MNYRGKEFFIPKCTDPLIPPYWTSVAGTQKGFDMICIFRKNFQNMKLTKCFLKFFNIIKLF